MAVPTRSASAKVLPERKYRGLWLPQVPSENITTAPGATEARCVRMYPG